MTRNKIKILMVAAMAAVCGIAVCSCNNADETKNGTSADGTTTATAAATTPVATTATPEPETTTEPPIERTKVIIDPLTESPFNGGKFEGWGTSLCWWANRLGYSDSLAEQSATLFFNKEAGLGMNIARYNIGGGDDPTHTHIKRTDSKMPGFTYYNEATGTYEFDKTADANQRNVLLRAWKASGDEFIAEAFSNSPPYYMTESGCSSGSDKAIFDNLRDDSVEAFADYLAEVALIYKNEYGLTFQSISPMNEPDTSYWAAYSNKQEGCHFSNGKSQSAMLVAMSEALKERELSEILVVGTDETSIDTQLNSFKKLKDEAKAVIARVDTHTYGGSRRKDLRELIASAGKNLWMSEVDGGSTLGNGAGQMGAGLWLANRIMDDMNGLMPSAWILWQAIDNHICAEGYQGNKDTGMPNTNGGYWGLAVADHDNDKIILTKKYYAYGQFSRYIRPGYTIIANDNADVLAAYDKDSKTLVIVAVNNKENEVGLDFSLEAFKYDGGTAKVIRTSGDMETGENWAELPNVEVGKDVFSIDLKEHSITTFIIENITY